MDMMKIVLLVILTILTILTMSLIPKSCGNPSLDPVDPLVVSLHGGLPGLAALLGDVQGVHLLHRLVGQVHLG